MGTRDHHAFPGGFDSLIPPEQGPSRPFCLKNGEHPKEIARPCKLRPLGTIPAGVVSIVPLEMAKTYEVSSVTYYYGTHYRSVETIVFQRGGLYYINNQTGSDIHYEILPLDGPLAVLDPEFQGVTGLDLTTEPITWRKIGATPATPAAVWTAERGGALQSATVTRSTAAPTTSSGTVLAANSSRIKALITNPGAVTVYVRCDGSAATTSDHPLDPGGAMEIVPVDGKIARGLITGITAAGTGALAVEEWT
jgi:hypothetical protein